MIKTWLKTTPITGTSPEIHSNTEAPILKSEDAFETLMKYLEAQTRSNSSASGPPRPDAELAVRTESKNVEHQEVLQTFFHNLMQARSLSNLPASSIPRTSLPTKPLPTPRSPMPHSPGDVDVDWRESSSDLSSPLSPSPIARSLAGGLSTAIKQTAHDGRFGLGVIMSTIYTELISPLLYFMYVQTKPHILILVLIKPLSLHKYF